MDIHKEDTYMSKDTMLRMHALAASNEVVGTIRSEARTLYKI